MNRHTSWGRPAVSVVVPFGGRRADGYGVLSHPASLGLDEGDELIVADNSAGGVPGTAIRGPWHIVAATTERSSYHARNAGAAAARNGWLLFLDADCAPSPELLHAFFARPIPERCGALAGQILGDPQQLSLAARYARSRHLFDHSRGLIRAEQGAAAAGNLLVRRRAFDAVGGFAEGIRSGGDFDLCRRLRAAGWRIGYRPEALVHHRHRDTMRSLLGAFARYGAGAHWLNVRHPGCSPRWPLAGGLAGAARDVARLMARRHREAALFRALDGLGLVAHNLGYLTGNEAGALSARGR
jgi:Glycosyltransferase like family 2